MKSVVGVGINGNYNSEIIDCFIEVREYNRKGKYHVSISRDGFN